MGHVLENKKTHTGRAGPQISSNINSSCTVTFHQKGTDTAKVDLPHGTVVETDHGPKMSQVVLSCFTPCQAASQSSLSVSRYEYLYETSFSERTPLPRVKTLIPGFSYQTSWCVAGCSEGLEGFNQSRWLNNFL